MATRKDHRESSGASAAEEWGRRLRRGDAAAYHRVRERVRRILSFRRLGLPEHARDDVEQETMTELWQAVNRSGFDFRAGFWGFVEVVTARRCIDWLRAQREASPASEHLSDRGASPLDRMLEGERMQIASQVIDELDPECRALITMRLREGMPYSGIARALGKSEGALRVQMHRCIRNAQRMVQRMDTVPRDGHGEGGPDGS